MDVQSLDEYILNKTGKRIQPAQKRGLQPTPREVARPVIIQNTGLSLPKSSVRSLIALERRARQHLPRHTYGALEEIATEVLELEDIYHITLDNTDVFDPISACRARWIYANSLWSRKLWKKGNQQALISIEEAIKGLLAAYRTAAAHKIVIAREHIEAVEWHYAPEDILALHAEARLLYQRGRSFEDGHSPDEARMAFKKSIVTIQRLYLEADHYIHTIPRSQHEDNG